jgi:hypothetical protein
MFGRSLGGAVATELATRHQPRALILESTFTSIRDMAAAAMPMLPIGGFLRTRYDTLKKIPKVAAPVYVVHSRDDEVVPYRQGVAIYEAANAPKGFLELRYGHNEGFILSGDAYTKGLDKFLTEQVAPRPPRPKEPPAPAPQPQPPSTAVPPSDAETEPDPEAPPATDAPDGGGAAPDEDLPEAEPPILD